MTTLLTRLALRRPLTAYVLMAIVVVGGIASYRGLPRESFPEIKIPLIIVSTPYPGASPRDVESQVTRKIETELKGISGVKEIRSTSFDGYSLIEVEFNPEVDLDTALQKVREGADRAEPDLPDDAEDVAITDVDLSRFPIMIVTLAGEFGTARLKAFADDVKDDLEAIPGVNLVSIVGGQEREVQVFADPRRLTAYRLGLADLIDAIRREHVNVPGGELDIGRQSFLVRLDAEARVPGEILDFVVEDRGGRPVRVRDVADVVYGFEEESTLARLNGRKAISLTIEKRTGANILEVADAVRAVVERYRAELPPSAEIAVLADQSIDIRDMNRDLENNILSGLLLVLAVLFAFLGFRAAVIVSAAIPLSMLVTFVVIAALGYTLNMVILFSLVLVLGMLVDNAIVTVENIYRHRELGDDPLAAAGRGASEVAMPIIASTATTLCAFAPMLMWPGIIGDFMKYLPITLIIGLSASLFVALVFNPALALVLFRRPPSRRRTENELGPLTRRYRTVLEACLDPGPNVRRGFVRNWLLLAGSVAALSGAIGLALAGMLLEVEVPSLLLRALVVAGGAAFALQGLLWLGSGLAVLAGRRSWMTDHRARLLWSAAAVLLATGGLYVVLQHGMEFFPETDPRQVWVDLEFPSGTNLEAQDALVRSLEARLGDTPDLDDMITNVGSKGAGMDPTQSSQKATHESRISLQLAKFHDRGRSSRLTMAEVRDEVRDVVGARVVVDREQEGPPTGKPVSVRLLGDDYDALGRAAVALRERMDHVPGLQNVADDFDEGLPEIRVRVDRDEAARANTNTLDIATAIRTAIAGTEAGKYRVGEDEYDIVVRLPRGLRRAEDSLREMTVQDDDGNPVPLRSLVTFAATAGPAAIRRVDLHRAVTVEADVDHAAGFTDQDRRAAVAAEIAAMELPPGVGFEFAGSNEEEEDSKRFLSRAFVIALLLIGLILVTEFDSLITPMTIMVSVVLSLIGVLWGLLVTGTPFGIIMTGIGVVSLAGIVVNNAIVLCDFIQQARAAGARRRDAILEAGTVRLRPVLLTAITTVLGLVPLTVGINLDFLDLSVSVGSESTQWWGPMGVAVIFGLTFATVLTLVVVPVTYDVLESLRERTGARI